MKHYGDITKISGAAAPPVNVIIGGSPCQDLSVARNDAERLIYGAAANYKGNEAKRH